VADAFGLARPARLARAELEKAVSPVLLSFMSESRQLDNNRLKRELGVRLRWPRVQEGLAAMCLLK
jgi:nucleoside-diphosphate-sugar epimerase